MVDGQSINLSKVNILGSKGVQDKMGQGGQYFVQEEEDNSDKQENQNNANPNVDRSAQLNATLNSLAMLNVASFLKNKKDQIKKSRNKNSKKEEKKDIEQDNIEDILLEDDYRD